MNEDRKCVSKTAPSICSVHKKEKSYLVHFYRWIYAFWFIVNCKKKKKKKLKGLIFISADFVVHKVFGIIRLSGFSSFTGLQTWLEWRKLLKTNTTHKDLKVGSKEKACWFKASPQSPLSDLIADGSREDWRALIRTKRLRHGSALRGHGTWKITITHRAKHSHTFRNRSEIWEVVYWSSGINAELLRNVIPTAVEHDCCSAALGSEECWTSAPGTKTKFTLMRLCKETLLLFWLSSCCWACEHNNSHSSSKIRSEGHRDES